MPNSLNDLPAPSAQAAAAAGSTPCVLFAGGGTGGHLFPGIAVAQELRRRHPGWQLHFVGTARGIEARQVPRYNFPLHLLSVRALRGRTPLQGLQGVAALPRAGLEALRLVGKLRPQVAVSMGGYAAGPAVVAARLLGVRCVVMEQNAFAGVTNRLLGKLAHHVLLALPNAQLQGAKAQVLGNPVRQDLVDLGALPLPILPAQFSPARPLRIFAFGGSQGARAINDVLLQLAAAVQKQGWPVALLHQTGAADHLRVTERYAAMGAVWARALPFVDDMAAALAEADLLVCRAGASTLAEACVVGRAALLVPYPFAADDHQSANARVLAQAGAALVAEEKALTPEVMSAHLAAFLQQPARLGQMAAASRALGRPEATEAIADVIEQEVQRVSQ